MCVELMCVGYAYCVWNTRTVCVGYAYCVWDTRSVCGIRVLCVWDTRTVCRIRVLYVGYAYTVYVLSRLKVQIMGAFDAKHGVKNNARHGIDHSAIGKLDTMHGISFFDAMFLTSYTTYNIYH